MGRPPVGNELRPPFGFPKRVSPSVSAKLKLARPSRATPAPAPSSSSPRLTTNHLTRLTKFVVFICEPNVCLVRMWVCRCRSLPSGARNRCHSRYQPCRIECMWKRRQDGKNLPLTSSFRDARRRQRFSGLRRLHADDYWPLNITYLKCLSAAARCGAHGRAEQLPVRLRL